MTKKERVEIIIAELDRLYPQAKCSLNYSQPHELLIATRLSAQCTDERVNKVTPALFARFPTLEAFADADFDEVCELVRSCGFYRGKAKSIIEMSQQLLRDYHGVLPDSIEELTKLSGVGRKTANLICGDVYQKPAIIADTHCIRISNKLGIVSPTTDPVQVEKQLKAVIPKERQTKFCHNLVHHGRAVCTARNPACERCTLSYVCAFAGKAKKNRDKCAAKQQ